MMSAIMDPSTQILTEQAHAKINLYLHVTGKRPDGYHLLDSLVVFAGAGDSLQYQPGAEPLHLELTGRFGQTLGADAAGPDNLVMKAAAALRSVSGSSAHVQGGRLVLTKELPVASGIGGGSADAAAAIRLLARAWQVDVPVGTLMHLAEKLGADVPVCVASQTARMEGIGEHLSAAPHLPACGMVLVNCGQAVSTPDVFRKRDSAFRERAILPAEWKSAQDMANDLARLGNCLEAPACEVCPPVRTVLSALAGQEDCLLARMSGSGATCFALFPSAEDARKAAHALGADHPSWWVWGGALA